MEHFGKFIGALMLFFAKMCIRAVVIGYPVMWLWNYTMPSMFGVAKIDFYHALAFTVMCGVLLNNGNSNTKEKNDTDGKN